jgi:ABC-type Fe3+-citrate transport system substrate-binding protein
MTIKQLIIKLFKIMIPKAEEMLPAEEVAKRKEQQKRFEAEEQQIAEAIKEAHKAGKREVIFVPVVCDEVNDGAVVVNDFANHAEDLDDLGYTVEAYLRPMCCNAFDAVIVYRVSW